MQILCWRKETLLQVSCLGFIMESGLFVEYSLKSLPLEDQLLQAAAFVNFEQRATADPLHAEYFINRYEIIL